MDGSRDSRTTRDEDAAVELAVLDSLIDLHPARLTVEELIAELAGEQPEFSERDAIERAIRDLAAAGLLHRREGSVEPSRAALRFSRLIDR
jgi:Fe2+ or Zn2+ uptake regulation protein